MAVHEAEQAEAFEALQVELGRARARTSSRVFEDVAAQPLVAALGRPAHCEE